MAFWKRNLALFKLGVITSLTYRFNFIIDALVQPFVAAFVEVFIWYAIFRTGQLQEIRGFGLSSYVAYTIWAATITRITTNWMYEEIMCTTIESGQLSAILLRPFSFFENFFSQFLGYKSVITVTSVPLPLLLVFALDLPTHWGRIPLMLLDVILSVFFIFLLSFLVACLAFHFTKTNGFTAGKNLALWFFAGELFPLDILPEPWKGILLQLPFAHGVFYPVGYVTGRISTAQLLDAMSVLILSIFFVGAAAYFFWRASLRTFTGTGA